jgi:hypothetical protein
VGHILALPKSVGAAGRLVLVVWPPLPVYVAGSMHTVFAQPKCDPHAAVKYCRNVLYGGHISQSLALFEP